IRILRDARFVYPGDFWLNIELGVVSMAMKKEREGAVRFFTAAVSIRPNALIAHRLLGVALHSQKRLDEAAAGFREGVRLDPTDPSGSRKRLGNILTDMKKWDEAVACFKEAIEHDPNAVWAHYELGTALSEQKKQDEAIAEFRQVIALEKKTAAAPPL